jgi:hypothetical protein
MSVTDMCSHVDASPCRRKINPDERLRGEPAEGNSERVQDAANVR